MPDREVRDYQPSKGLPSFWANLLIFLLMAAWVSFTIFAIFWVGYTSLKSDQALFEDVWALPGAPQWENYRLAWSVANVGRYFYNSIIVTTSTVFLRLLIGSMAAYSLTRLEWKGRQACFYYFLAGFGVPASLLLVPLFMLLQNFNIESLKLFEVAGYWLIHIKDFYLMDSRLGLIVVYTTLGMPFTVYILSGFFRTLPGALGEAAAIDGASDYQIFWRVYLPLAKPGLITVGIFNFIYVWNEYQFALVLISNPKLYTLPLGLYMLQAAARHANTWTMLFAGLVILMVPTIVIFLSLHDRITKGLTAGAIKE